MYKNKCTHPNEKFNLNTSQIRLVDYDTVTAFFFSWLSKFPNYHEHYKVITAQQTLKILCRTAKYGSAKDYYRQTSNISRTLVGVDFLITQM